MTEIPLSVSVALARSVDPDVLHCMQKIGGGFSSALAKAWFLADTNNSAKLYAAFHELYDNYARIVRDERERRDAKGADDGHVD